MNRFPQLAPLGIAALFVTIGLYHGLRATDGLNWPPDNDAYRDIALARIILDGDYPADYLFENEWLWYNPLAGTLVAAGAWIADIDPPQADVRIGPWVNLAVPVTFFILVWYLTDAWVAVAALLSFMFFLPLERPTYVSASYSPWLFAPHLSQGLFYSTLLAWIAHLRSKSLGSTIAVGILLGITFLGHTAPAVLLGCIMIITTVRTVERERMQAANQIRHLALALAIAFIISLPFSLSVLFRYRLHVHNAKPAQWVWDGVALENLPAILLGLLTLKNAVILLGLFAFLRRVTPRPVKEAVVSWLAVSLAFLAYSFAAQWAALRGWTLPQITPGYHYMLYVLAAGHFLFSMGLVVMVESLLAHAGRKMPILIRHSTVARGMCVAAIITALFAANYRDFRVWHGFTRDRSIALLRQTQLDDFEPYNWIVKNVNAGAVFLCNDRPGLNFVAPAGGRAIANSPYFSSPYLAYAPRAQARETLWKALREKDVETFRRVSSEYHVAFLLAEGEQREWAKSYASGEVSCVFESDQFAIYQVTQSAP